MSPNYYICFSKLGHVKAFLADDWANLVARESSPDHEMVIPVNAPDIPTAIAWATARRLNHGSAIAILLHQFLKQSGWQLDVIDTELTAQMLEDLDHLLSLYAGEAPLLKDMTCIITTDGDATWCHENVGDGLVPIESDRGHLAWARADDELPVGWHERQN